MTSTIPSTKPILHKPVQSREAGCRVDRGIGVGKTAKGEIVFIHASACKAPKDSRSAPTHGRKS